MFQKKTTKSAKISVFSGLNHRFIVIKHYICIINEKNHTDNWRPALWQE